MYSLIYYGMIYVKFWSKKSMKTILTTVLGFLCFSALAQIDNCCINPDWIEPEAMCISVYDPVIGCDGITYGNACLASSSGVTSYTNQSGIVSTIDWDCSQSNLCTSWSGVLITEAGFWTNPNDPCEMGDCSSTGAFSGVIVDCMEEMGLPCNGEWLDVEGECCSICIESSVICTSYTGVGIYETGDWTNPNDPCDMGYCGDDGFFSGLVIDCGEPMGMPCDGEWVLEDGACCSTCIETPPLNCEDIIITLTNGWNMIGFGCAENTDAIVAFTSIVNKIVIVKDGIGSAYLPDWEFNGIGDLERGYGYLIKVTEEITNYNICD